MQLIDTVLEILALPFLNLLQSTGRLSWIYLTSSLLIGFLTIVLSNFKNGSFDVGKIAKQSLDFSHWKHRSARVDYLYYFIETILYTMFVSYFVITTVTVSVYTFVVLCSFIGEFSYPNSILFKSIYTLLFLIAYDGGRFLVHKWLHMYPMLWEFHKFHHSAIVLNPFTVYRIHPMESFFLNSMSGLCTGIITGVFVLFFPLMDMYTFLGVNFGLFVFHLYSNLRHTHIWLNFSPRISYIFLSPAQHQIHHSKADHHANQNLGAIFGFWDFLNGTLYIPKEREELAFGLPVEPNLNDYQNIGRIFYIPFVRSFQIAKSSVEKWLLKKPY